MLSRRLVLFRLLKMQRKPVRLDMLFLTVMVNRYIL